MNPFYGVFDNHVFLSVSVFSVCCQIILVQFGGAFVGTSPLDINQWIITVLLGAIGLPIGVMMRYIPIKEDENSFFTPISDHDKVITQTTTNSSKSLKSKYEPLLSNDLSVESGLRV